MDLTIRPAIPSDTEACGRIMHEAFQQLNEAHGFANTDFPTIEAGRKAAEFYIGNPRYFGLVAEVGGRVVGSNFLDERNLIRGIATVSVDPGFQGGGVGRKLMKMVLERCRDTPGVRLLQHPFNVRSMALYTSLGFDAKEVIMLLSGSPRSAPALGYHARRMMQSDLAACSALCTHVHGFDRGAELEDALRWFLPVVVTRDERIVAYASAADNWAQNHGVAESEAAMRALFAGMSAFLGDQVAFLLPVRQASLFRWCLGEGMLVVKPFTLMVTGRYQDPNGSYYTSVVY